MKIENFAQLKMKKIEKNEKKFKFSQKKRFFAVLMIVISFCVLLTNCASIPNFKKEQISKTKSKFLKKSISRTILGKGKLNLFQLTNFFLSQNPNVKYEDMLAFAALYISEAEQENINSDVAFAQMCLETGFLQFGNLVTPEMNNFCGLGAMDKDNPGCIFESKKQGIRAHIQHLQAYATTEDVLLNNELVDPRYSWVHKTKFVEDVFGLAGTWATDKNYGTKLDAILSKMEIFLE